MFDSGLNQDVIPDERVLATLNAVNPEGPSTDSIGHGTQMALVASGVVAPFGSKESNHHANQIVSIRTFDKNGYTSNFSLMRGIEFAVANKTRVASLSWGSNTESQLMNDVFEYDASQGLFIVASAGNKPTGKPVYPAGYESVTGIGALAPDGNNWEQTNSGDFVDIYAPGFADMPVGYGGEPGFYAGTSISSAFAANRIAAFLSKHPDADRKTIKQALFPEL